MLLFGQLAEEINLAFVRRTPLVISLEGRLEVCLDVHVECLGLKLGIRRIVHARDRFG